MILKTSQKGTDGNEGVRYVEGDNVPRFLSIYLYCAVGKKKSLGNAGLVNLSFFKKRLKILNDSDGGRKRLCLKRNVGENRRNVVLFYNKFH